MSGPAARLKQIASALTGVTALTGSNNPHVSKEEDPNFKNENRLKFQAGLPAGLAINHTPLNPVSFLLRSATVRPNRTAMIHPAKNASWTYAEWWGDTFNDSLLCFEISRIWPI